MGFKLVSDVQPEPININTLTVQMILDLISCYGADIPAVDVEARHELGQRAGVFPNYPIISKDVVEQFYQQLDMLKQLAIDVIIANYKVIDNDGNRVQGTVPVDYDNFRAIVCTIVERDFYEANTWIYDYSEGHFEMIQPLVEQVLSVMYSVTANSVWNDFVTIITEHYGN